MGHIPLPNPDRFSLWVNNIVLPLSWQLSSYRPRQFCELDSYHIIRWRDRHVVPNDLMNGTLKIIALVVLLKLSSSWQRYLHLQSMYCGDFAGIVFFLKFWCSSPAATEADILIFFHWSGFAFLALLRRLINSFSSLPGSTIIINQIRKLDNVRIMIKRSRPYNQCIQY